MGVYDQLFGVNPNQLSKAPGVFGSMMAGTPVSAPDSSKPSGLQNAAGIIGDALLTAFGHQAIYGPNALAAAKIQPDPLDQEYKRAQIAALQAKPAGPAPTEFQRDYEWLKSFNPKAADDFIASKTAGAPVVYDQYNPTTNAMDHIIGTRASLTGNTVPTTAPEGVTFTPRPMPGGAPSQGGATFSPSQAYDAVIQQESGGRAGAIGPQTRYGRAQGSSQMLPATAQEMAGKLGVPWSPAMMTGKTPQAAAYQRALGQTYFEQGLAATGNIYDAARYYHGGPSRSMWGPKTNAYADAVTARLGG